MEFRLYVTSSMVAKLMINLMNFADYHRSFTLFPYMMLICAVKWNLNML